MEFGVAIRAHVGHVDVADPSVGRLVHIAAVRFDPIAIASRALIVERFHGDRVRLRVGGTTNGQQDLVAGLVDQVFRRRDARSEALSVDGEHVVALMQIDPRTSQG